MIQSLDGEGGMIPYFETSGVSEVGSTGQSLFNLPGRSRGRRLLAILGKKAQYLSRKISYSLPG